MAAAIGKLPLDEFNNSLNRLKVKSQFCILNYIIYKNVLVPYIHKICVDTIVEIVY